MSISIIDVFIESLNQFLLKCVSNHTLNQLLSSSVTDDEGKCKSAYVYGFKPFIIRENGSKTKGDFSLTLNKNVFQLFDDLTQLCDQLVAESADWPTFSVIKYNIITQEFIKIIRFYVNRETAVHNIIDNFSDFLNTNSTKTDEKSLIICVKSEVKNRFTSERLEKVSKTVSKLLNTSCVDLNFNQISDEMIENMKTFAENSEYCETNDKNQLIFRLNSDRTGSCDDLTSIVIDKSSRFMFELMYNLYELLKNYSKMSRDLKIISIISETLFYRFKQTFRLICLLYGFEFNHKLILTSNVNTDQQFDAFVQGLRQTLVDQSSDSSEKSSENIETLINTSLTLSLLSTTPSSVITRLDSHLNQAIFIQYNCARLKAVINRYNNEFAAKSTESAINTSLLTHDMEWSLIFSQFSDYQRLIATLNEFLSNDSNIFPLNRFILYLKRLVNEISVYYKKVKILTEPSPHLLPLIATRIHFCVILLQSLTNCLFILGLDSVDYL